MSTLQKMLVRLAHDKPSIRLSLVPLLRNGGWDRRGAQYPGFSGPKHNQAIEKGYIDAGLVDPDFVKKYPRKFIQAVLKHFPLDSLLDKGIAFIRDPKGSGATASGSASAFAAHVEKNIRWDASLGFLEDSRMSEEREDWESSGMAGAVADGVEAATFTVTPVKGRTGAGYKVTMRPKLDQIKAKAEADFKKL